MRVGLIGTGAISHKHAQAYKNIGFEIACCWNRTRSKAEEFAAKYGGTVKDDWMDVVTDRRVDFVDICTFPDFRVPIVQACARHKKHVQLQKPIAVDLTAAATMIRVAKSAGIQLGVVSQRRFDDSTIFVKKAMEAGRLGRILQADAYVKWWRTPEYYSRPEKGSWAVEGGGALINQSIHQVDILLHLAGPIGRVFGFWQLGGLHKIESEDAANAVMRYESGAMGVLQGSTSFWPGYPERVEIHGTKGTAIISADRLTAWDVKDDSGEAAPIATDIASGASDPMAISLVPFERQFLDFGEACRSERRPVVAGEDGYRALALVLAIYESARSGNKVTPHAL
jgi:UDP-N-acetyl-2-amino-2-deoxyglucuronate dehydrogenase